MGRRPLPAEVKRAKGNPGKRKIVDAPLDLVAPSAPSSAPKNLSNLARQVWDRMAPRLEELRFLRVTDTPAFARYCTDLAKWWECEMHLRKRGTHYTSKSKHGTLHRINPSFLIQERLDRRLVAQEDRFGMSPSARQRLMLQIAGMSSGMPNPTGAAPKEGDDAGKDEPGLGLEPAGALIGGLNGSRAVN